MINITDKSKCSGCSACVQKCPVKCISLQLDDEGFLYPKVNMTQCVGCSLCEKVCHVLNSYEPQEPIRSIASKHRNNEIRFKSSSGGVFTAMASKVIDEGGVVFGVSFDNRWNVVFSYAETDNEIYKFRGSKYVQANVGKAFAECKDFLNKGRKVLFCGTPCHISGLYHFLGKRYDGLLVTVDFVCHGVPSQKLWTDYLKQKLSEIIKNSDTNVTLESVKEINFRDKNNSWNQSDFKINVDNQVFYTAAWDNPYMRAFLSDYSLRPSCYDCHVKSGRSGSDITIGDCWGIEKIMPSFYDDKGVSLVLINTNRGRDLFDKLDLESIDIPLDQMFNSNPSIISCPDIPSKRDIFFKLLRQGKSLEEVNEVVHSVPFYQRLVWSLKRFLRINK